MAQVKAPWTQEQVNNLNEYQHAGFLHPFTCRNDQSSGHLGVLVATSLGWVCPFCHYTQDWAHDFMANGEAVRNYEKLPSPLREVLAGK